MEGGGDSDYGSESGGMRNGDRIWGSAQKTEKKSRRHSLRAFRADGDQSGGNFQGGTWFARTIWTSEAEN